MASRYDTGVADSGSPLDSTTRKLNAAVGGKGEALSGGC